MPIANYAAKFLSLNVNDILNNFYFDKESEYTLTIWIKYHGQLVTNKDDCVILFRFTADGKRFICYHSQNLSLYFYEDTQILYEDKSFTYNIGKWTLLAMSSFINDIKTIPGLKGYFGFLYRFYVNNSEIAKKETVDILAPGWKFDAIEIGYGFSALIADIRIYKNFIVNPWGYITGPKKSISLMYSFPLDGKIPTGECLPENKLKLANYQDIKQEGKSIPNILGITCKPDYSPYLAGTSCSSNTFLDDTNFGKAETPCSKCNSDCVDNCVDGSALGCVCDFVTGSHALRIDSDTKKLYCEYLPYTDFAKLERMKIPNIKMAAQKEYTIELWFYLYTYTNSTAAFDSHEIIWDYHNRLRIFNSNSTVLSACTPIYNEDKDTELAATEKAETITNALFNWVYLTCSVNVNTKSFYNHRLNDYTIETPINLYPDFSTRDTTSLIIQPSRNARANFGLLFIKDIKLWSLYNIKRFNTQC